MPGILPMKVIKVGTSAQTRIAQACDRCRSKKIRCDGFRPTCTQCANVGFDCKTSDKLSRRAFPRGYTESLEDRVRSLETEVRELKDLLDEKDEKIEMLSKMHSHSRPGSISSRRPSSIASPSEKGQIQATQEQEKDKDTKFKLQQSHSLTRGQYTDCFFEGNSSSRAFLQAFERKLQESGKGTANFNIEAFFAPSPKAQVPALTSSEETSLWTPPSRLHSDQMVNIFFQEWAPLFPVLHRPTFLDLYHQYTTNASNIQDKKSLAQLNLVFGIAALSNESRIGHSAELCERQWSTALDSFVKESSMTTLQCLILAQIFCIQKGDFDKVIHYKGLAVAISQRLGLHLSQKRFQLGTLTVETRRKVFWSLYAVDCFSSVLLGLPKSIAEDDVFCEYPTDADDENVTEKGFLHALPGEYTKISSALALFRGCRILAKVLNQNYPAATSHELSLQRISELDQELEAWSSDLPSHLKLQFAMDKPATGTISSRSPLLSLTYNFIRTLIHGPAVSANLGDKASSSVVALAKAYKQIIQIVQLLDERSLSFSHCLNKNELLLMSGTGLLFQSLDLDQEGQMMKDSQRLVCTVIQLLGARNAPSYDAFKQLGCSMLSIPSMSRPSSAGSNPETIPKKSKSKSNLTPSEEGGRHNQLAALTARYTIASGNKPKKTKESRKSMPVVTSMMPSQPMPEKTLRPLAPSLPSNTLTASSSSTTPAIQVTRPSPMKRQSTTAVRDSQASRTNLDYLSFSDNMPPEQARSDHHRISNHDTNSWETLLTNFDDAGKQSSSNSIYEWPPMDAMISPTSLEPSRLLSDANHNFSHDTTWEPEMWNFPDEQPHNPQSVLSFSDESLTSGEEFSSVEYASNRSDSGFRTISIPHFTPEQGFSPEMLGEAEALHQ